MAKSGHVAMLTDAARDGASVRPSGFVDFVLVRARACAVLADADGSMAISPICASSPFLVVRRLPW
jgi:hypothetical protein